MGVFPPEKKYQTQRIELIAKSLAYQFKARGWDYDPDPPIACACDPSTCEHLSCPRLWEHLLRLFFANHGDELRKMLRLYRVAME